MKYSRVSLVPLNPVTDYDYFVTCLHRSLQTILPTNLVQEEHHLVNVRLLERTEW